MSFKFPSVNIARSGASDLVQGGSLTDVFNSTVVRSTTAASNQINSYGNNLIGGALNSLGTKLGVKLGGTTIDKLITDPTGALSDILVGGSGSGGALYQRLTSRPDPLWEMDWDVVLPLNLKSEYVEDIQWSHSRFNATSGIFRNGTHIFMAESIETAPLTLTLYEDRLMTATNWIYGWRGLMYDAETATFNYPGKYKQNIRATFKDVTGKSVGEVLFSGCFPTNLPQVNMASETSQRHRLQIEISCDRITFSGTAGTGIGVIQGFANTLTSQLKAGVGGSLSGLASGAFGSLTNGVASLSSDLSNAFNNLTSIRF